MKIAVVFDGLGYGGIERVGIDYIKILQRLGHEVDVYNINPKNTDMERLLPNNCHIVHHSFNQFLCPELYSFGVKKWWWGKFAYPIIHLGLSVIIQMRKIIEKNRIKNYDLAIAFSGHFNDLTFVASGFIKSRKKMCWLHGALYGYLLIADGYIHLYNKIKNLVVLVEDAQEEALIYNKFIKLNINKLYNPTYIAQREIDEIKVKELKNLYGDFILMVARFAYPHKDHYTVINAIVYLKEVYKLKINIIFIGDGPEYQNVKKYCEKCKVDDQVYFLGSKYDVENYYLACKIVVHASVAGEGLPTVILEAFSFGKPIVVTDSKVGPREILKDNEYGLLCNVKDGSDMAKQIYRLLTDESLFNYYVDQGYKRIKDFDPEVIALQLEKILTTLN